MEDPHATPPRHATPRHATPHHNTNVEKCFGSDRCTLQWVSFVAESAMAFDDLAADDWRRDAHGDADRHIFNTDSCTEPYEDSDYAGDNVKVWAWTEEDWVELDALRQKTTLPEFRDKGSGVASSIESIDFQEINFAFEKHVERQKLEGQEQWSGSKGLEEICGDTLIFDNSDNGGLNKDLGH